MLGDVAFAQAPFASQGGNTFNVAVSEAGSIVDALGVPIVTYGGAIAESASGLNTQSVIATFVGNNSESASAADVLNTLNNTFNVLLSAGASGSDAVSVQSNFVVSVSEAASAIAESLSQVGFTAAIVEAASTNSAQQSGLVILVSISEAASGVDARAGNIISTVTIQESASAISSQSVTKTFNVDATGVQLVVRIGSILIWAEIDDSQTPNWQNIPT